MQPFFILEMPRSHKLPNLDKMVDVEAALYPVPLLCPTKRDYYGLARYHGGAESQTSEALGAFFY